MKRKFWYHTALALIISFMTLGASAQSSDSAKLLSLSEAIDLSIKNSKELKLNHAKIDEALATLREAKDARLPDLSVSASYLRLTDPGLTLKNQKPDNGGGSSSGSSTPSINQAMYAMVNGSLPLFTGFKIKSSIESAQYLAEAARLDADNDRDAIIANAVSAYANLYKAGVSVDLVKENLVRSQQRVADFESLEKNGLLARNDLLKVQLEAYNVELALMNAQTELKITTVNMNLMLGLPESTKLVVDTTGFKLLTQNKTIDEWEQLAHQNRKDIQVLSLNEKAANSNIKAVKGDMYPSLALTAGYVGLDIPNFVTVTTAFTAGVGVKYNVSSLWKTKAKLNKANSQLQEVQVHQEMLDDNIRLDITKAYEAYYLAMKKIDVYTKAVEQADENYRITKNKQANNLATTTDLLDADVASLTSKINYNHAKADAVVAYNKLLQASGIIATEKGISK
ncbi:TolC family protein [Pinibacter soli]|uniref:TolC family protein n=1 Tax=Pinibacter soli TaxID=3044211 RepID=A0ABT6R7J9_9BACT|nr:TolC family protein [Pinibacter soli]MDI3318436.1 TolC family protein [Pinibacter soli]